MGGTIPGHGESRAIRIARAGAFVRAILRGDGFGTLYHRRMPDLLLLLIIILVLAVVWRGPKTLPKLGEALGRGVREARTEAAKAQDEIQTRMGATDEPTKPDDDQPG